MSIAERVTSGPWVPRPDSFAKRLAWVRLELNITQAEAAAACDIKQPTWASWEANPHTAPRNMAEVVRKIQRGLGVNPEWLMWGDPLSMWYSDAPSLTSVNTGVEDPFQLRLHFERPQLALATS